jgi:diaminopimelate decarboxylase
MNDLSLFPTDTGRNNAGRLVIGGCDVSTLAAEFGTPLYIYDETTLRQNCRAYIQPLQARYPNASVTYAGKAYLDPTVLSIIRDEGLGLDAVSGGEISLALAGGFPPEDIVFHGNNKLPHEIALALDAGIGKFAVDGLDDLHTLSSIAGEKNRTARIILRLTPGISAHTHEYIRTGMLDSKFGIPISTGQAEHAVQAAMAADGIELVGYHAHIGSQIFDVEPFADNVTALVEFALAMEAAHGAEFSILSPGGGGGVRYVGADDGLDAGRLVDAIVDAVLAALPAGRRPELVLEPGRSIVAPAGVALYEVGTIKSIPGVRTYVAVDGGMADNIRPALYQAEYTAVLANRSDEGPTLPITIAGRYCETGDLLIKDIQLPELRRGDLLAMPTAGAYNLSMSSNYNLALRPAAVVVTDGRARLSRRRETYDDLLALYP